MLIKLNYTNFFKYFILHPRSTKLSPTDRKVATLLTIICGLGLGVIHLISLCLYDRKIGKLSPKKILFYTPINPTTPPNYTKPELSSVRRRLNFDDL